MQQCYQLAYAMGVVIGAGSVVTKNITEKGIYAGNPAKKLRDLP